MKALKDFFTGRGNKVTDTLTYQNRDNKMATNENLYQCPMKCEGDKSYETPGNCPVCNMKLIPAGTKSQSAHSHQHHGCC